MLSAYSFLSFNYLIIGNNWNISLITLYLQDFEIAGSRTAVDEDGEGGQAGAGEGSSPESEAEGGARSLGGTVHSWDSHANYHHDLGDDDEGRMLFRGVIVYCDDKHLKSATGIVRILLLVSFVLSTSLEFIYHIFVNTIYQCSVSFQFNFYLTRQINQITTSTK